MKKISKTLCLVCCVLGMGNILHAQKVTIENIKEQCSGISYNQKVRLSVSSFNVSTLRNRGEFGDELAQMLTNALQEVNCFNVLLSLKDSKELTDEIEFGQSGNTATGSSPITGKMKGAQVIVLGKVTEYSEGETKFQAFGVGGTTGNKAKIGFIIQLINAESREIIDSKSINVEGKSSGFSGAQLFGVGIVGGKSNKSIQDACEKGIIQAVEFIASRKEKMPLPKGNSGAAVEKKFNPTNCASLKGLYKPKIMVILPEFHIMQRIPDPAGETEINRKFVEAGFQVVDAAMYAAISKTEKFDQATKDPMKAISLGKQFGADIVIYGEAFSNRSDNQKGTQVSCRARVEVKAVRTDNATIVATNGLEAGAMDNSEFVAAKSALRAAASLIADYMLEQFCSKQLTFSKSGVTTKASATVANSVTEIDVINADYSKLKELATALAVKGKVLEKNLSEGKGYIKFEHIGSSDSIADFIDNKFESKFSIKDLSSGKIILVAK